jgi:hypothetical protein
MTTIKVSVPVRDRVRQASAGRTQSETVAAALDALEREQFWAAIGSQVPDEEYVEQAERWASADLTSMRPRLVGRSPE